MIMNMSGGGGKPYAIIGVTFPSGSTVTCVKSGVNAKLLRSTSTHKMFSVPDNGTWVVTATLDDDTATQSVTVSAEGQVTDITLSYWDGTLYDNGETAYATWAHGATTGSPTGTFDKESTFIKLYGSTDSTIAVTNSKINTTGFSKLKVTVDSSQWANASLCGIAIYSGDDITHLTRTAYQAGTSGATTVELNISSYQGQYYIGVYAGKSSNYGQIKFTKVKLEASA